MNFDNECNEGQALDCVLKLIQERQINPLQFLLEMESVKAIDREQMEARISSKGKCAPETIQFFSTILRRSPNWYQEFILVLKKENYDDIAEIMIGKYNMLNNKLIGNNTRNLKENKSVTGKMLEKNGEFRQSSEMKLPQDGSGDILDKETAKSFNSVSNYVILKDSIDIPRSTADGSPGEKNTEPKSVSNINFKNQTIPKKVNMIDETYTKSTVNDTRTQTKIKDDLRIMQETNYVSEDSPSSDFTVYATSNYDDDSLYYEKFDELSEENKYSIKNNIHTENQTILKEIVPSEIKLNGTKVELLKFQQNPSYDTTATNLQNNGDKCLINNGINLINNNLFGEKCVKLKQNKPVEKTKIPNIFRNKNKILQFGMVGTVVIVIVALLIRKKSWH